MPPHISFRTLQFNVLADGLGLLQRNNPNNLKQYSFLSKVSDEHLSWEYRKRRVMVRQTMYARHATTSSCAFCVLFLVMVFSTLILFILFSRLIRERSLSILQTLSPCRK